MIKMPDYRKMYYRLFRAHAKVLAVLQQATLETEQMGVEAKEPAALPTVAQSGEKGYNQESLENQP